MKLQELFLMFPYFSGKDQTSVLIACVSKHCRVTFSVSEACLDFLKF